MTILETGPVWRVGAPEAGPGSEPLLGIRALAYRAEGQPGALPPIPGLAVKAIGVIGARPAWDAATGQMRFAELPPGPRRILVTDPERRFMPVAVMVDVPPRYPVRPTAGGPALPIRAHPIRRTVLLRPAPARAVPDGVTAVIGTLRDAEGRGIPLGRIAATTDAGLMRVVGWTDGDGHFALLLPDNEAGSPPATCQLALHVPDRALAAALAADLLGGLPPDLDHLDPDGPDSPLARREVVALGPDGMPVEARAGALPLRPGRTIRWDLVAA